MSKKGFDFFALKKAKKKDKDEKEKIIC